MVPKIGFVTRNTHVKNQSPSTHCSKVISKVKVFKNGSNSKVKVTGSKIMVSTEKSYKKEYQSSSTHYSPYPTDATHQIWLVS